MSRVNDPGSGSEAALEAAQAWKERCLLSGGSIFSDRELWTRTNLQDLKTHFVDRPDDGADVYAVKLKKQLGKAAAPARQLFAEMQWVLYLFARDIVGPDTKREDTRKIWAWSGEELDAENPYLGRCLDPGVGNPGTTFNTLRWREMHFMIRFGLRWVDLSDGQRRQLLSEEDAFAFGQWLDETEESERRCARNIVCFLLLPDRYERISSGSRKRQILREVAASLADDPGLPRPGPSEPLFEVDRALFNLRQVLERKYGRTDLDFFREPLRQLWRPSQAEPVEDTGAEDSPPEGPPPAPPGAYSAESLAKDTWTIPERIEGWLALLRRKRQLVLQGPSGTGKTKAALGLARILTSAAGGAMELVQFHPSYSYEDFITGIRPDLKADGQLAFAQKDGLFLQFCAKAESLLPAPCVLVIDEINRANLSDVFGELLFALEYRDTPVQLGSGRSFRIPPNVYLVGTMNTVDRSIALVDLALRRRFCFVHLGPDFDALRGYLEHHGLPAAALLEVLGQINQAIADEDCLLGISYFMKDGAGLRDSLESVWRTEVEPFLHEAFYNQSAQRDRFSWQRLAANELKEWK